MSASLAALVAVTVLVPAGSAAQSLGDARAERAAIQERLDDAATELNAIQERVALLEAETTALEDESSSLRAEVAALQDGMQDQVAALFKRGSVRDPLTVFLTSDDPQEALFRAQAIEQVVVGDLGEIEALSADRRRLTAVDARLREQQAELDAAIADQEALTGRLGEDLERAQELEERLEAEERERREAEERRRREAEARAAREREAAAAAADAPAAGGDAASDDDSDDTDDASDGGSDDASGGGSTAVGGSGMACPVGNPLSFSDTWGAPRSGGRAHRGTDMLAPYGTPVYAIVSGTWGIQSPGPSAGLWAILRGDDGNQYWYMHLQSHTVSGGRVEAGQQVATNGDTGNARGTPHVHFELHPGGGGAINPYPTLRGIC